MEWSELLKITGPVGGLLIALILAPWAALWCLSKWIMERHDRDLDARVKLAVALDNLTDIINRSNHHGH